MQRKKVLIFRVLAILLMTITIMGSFTGCKETEEKKYTSGEDFKNARLGVIAGTPAELATKKEYPDAEHRYFLSLSDMLIALKTKKIDGFILNKLFYYGFSWEIDNITYIEQPIGKQEEYSYVFSQNDRGHTLKSEMDDYVASLRESGELAALHEKWFSEVRPDDDLDYSQLPATNGVIRVAAGSDNKPFLYKQNGEFTGYEVEVLIKFAKEHGYAIEMTEVNFDGMLAGVNSGKYDIGAFAINYTEEREESTLFSEPTIAGELVVFTSRTEKKKTIEDVKNGTIGILTGSIYNGIISEKLPDVTIKNFSTPSDVILAMEQGKVDCYIEDDTFYYGVIWEKDNITYTETDINKYNLAVALSKELDPEIKSQLNEFIINSKNNGVLEDLNTKWFSGKEPKEHPDYKNLPATNGVIRVAVDPSMKPNVYKKGSQCSGFEMELITMFAEEYGYAIDLYEVAFASVLAGLSTNKYDMSLCGISITEERKETMDFSEPYYVGTALLIYTKDIDENKSIGEFFAGLKDSFSKTFIREDRWKLIVEGICVTLLISICAAVSGTVIGFGLFLLGRSDIKIIRKIARGFAKVYARIVNGTPIVVILMILFYVVFASARNMSGIVIAIIGFAITFGSFVCNHMTVSVNSIDYGQTEAAYALGYTKNKTFFRIIFPQAASIFLPSYVGQAVELIKATAVVGYIAVNDLTKMGDIIRSNTYEAFFPLIAVAVIYFLLTWIMSLLLSLIQRKYQPKRRKKEKILKGVKNI